MIDPVAQLLFILAAWVVFSLLRQRHPELVLSFFGALFLVVYAPVAFAWIAFTVIEASILVKVLAKRSRSDPWRQYLPYVLLLNLFFVDLHAAILLMLVETLAISFSVIRVFMTVKQSLASRTNRAGIEHRWIWYAAYYLPALIVGPVFSGTDLKRQAAAGAPPDRSARTVRFLLTGLVTVWLINPALLHVARSLNGLPTTVDLGWEGAPLLFAILFTGFYGQSLLAEYSSRLFGRELPRNFDRPWMARNIRDFWQRWHRSMAQFVMQYIYLPLTLKSVNGRVATVLAFVFMGLWHNLSAGYLVWGFSHGLLLAFWPKESGHRLAQLAERLLTWAAVIGLSYVANYSWLA